MTSETLMLEKLINLAFLTSNVGKTNILLIYATKSIKIEL